MIQRTTVDEVLARSEDLEDDCFELAASIVREVRFGGVSMLRTLAERWDDLAPGAPLSVDRAGMEAAWWTLEASTRDLLTRSAERIHDFAEAQRQRVTDLVVEKDGMTMGHECVPVAAAGCYAPGGRYPLPSSVLMTAVTARVAGVDEVVVASPRPQAMTLGAAFLAGADHFLPVGGAQAVAAMAYGVGSPRCAVIVGPGNRFVTAAKHAVSRHVGIDMLAGPSELTVIADPTADPELVAADLLAQAEHDPAAMPVLLTTDEGLADRVTEATARQLEALSSADVARAALRNGGIVLCENEAVVAATSDALAPEHLALHVADPESWRGRLREYGAIFLGGGSAEVFGDYGVGPNHTLPTGGRARHTGGLSVFDFLRFRTFLSGQPSAALVDDVERFAELEGLPGHARAAAMRRRI